MDDVVDKKGRLLAAFFPPANFVPAFPLANFVPGMDSKKRAMDG